MADSRVSESKERQTRVKLKTPSQEEILLKWKEHFMNLLGNPPEIIDKPIQKIIKDQLEQFMLEELDVL